jgi:mono/diheme cytochrome c family protein
MRRRWLACSAIVAAVLATGCGGGGDGGPQAPSGDQAAGQDAFERSCATCHGQEARGTDTGQPLVDRIYEPSHHGDAAFQLAVRGGSPQHHWSFGDMPAVPDVSDQEIVDIVAYVRALQEAAGIR